jgi:osmotically-inducible protein OsmY
MLLKINPLNQSHNSKESVNYIKGTRITIAVNVTNYPKSLSRILVLLLILIPTFLLQGCAGLVIGAAGGFAVAAHDRRDTQTMIKDEKIESNAANSLYDDPKLKNKIHINITSYNQVVLVTGEVLSSGLRDYAIDIVRNIKHVKRVHNELAVADLTSFSSRTGDSWITSKVKSKMLGTKGMDATRVKVVTENGKVYLMGLVTDKEAELAVEVTRHVKNVKQVIKIFEIIPEPIVNTAPVVEKSK